MKNILANKLKKKGGFTYAELLVAVIVLTILLLISFIVLKGSIRDTRNTKRLSDVKSLFLKIETESLRGTDYSKIMNTEEKTPTSLTINGKDGIEGFQNIENPINRDVLRENGESFKDPLNNHPYPFAYVIGDSNEIGYDFIQLAYVEEGTGRTTKLVGNYNKILPGDSPSLFTKEGMNGVNIPEDYIADGGEPIYSNSQSDSQTSYVSPKEVYGDEDEDAIAACNKWVEQAVGDKAGGYKNWIWVPVRYFTNDEATNGIGISLADDFYRREITYNGKTYICKGFAVMKYEASEVGQRVPTSDTSNKSRLKITQTNAIERCNSLGTSLLGTGNYHLITNNEWMAIARNIEQQATNWSTGQVGSGFIYTGIVSGGDFGALPGDDLTELVKMSGDRRALKLSNGAVIWDLSGNSREHVNKANTIDGSNYNSNDFRKSNACGGRNRQDFSKCNFTNGYTYSNIGPATENLDRNYGIGGIRSDTKNQNVFTRGGDAGDGGNAGIFSLYLELDHNGTGYNNSSGDISFHCSL